jgi:hypothetical protein
MDIRFKAILSLRSLRLRENAADGRDMSFYVVLEMEDQLDLMQSVIYKLMH